jgi:hypothetical protein
MVQGRAAALANARRQLAQVGKVVVIDFADLSGFPSPLANAFRAYLHAFRVEPLDAATLQGAAWVRFGPGRYYVAAGFGPDR